jgi:hypothetical protein
LVGKNKGRDRKKQVFLRGGRSYWGYKKDNNNKKKNPIHSMERAEAKGKLNELT